MNIKSMVFAYLGRAASVMRSKIYPSMHGLDCRSFGGLFFASYSKI